MTTLNYIRLRNSTGSLDKRFRVVQGSLKPFPNKMESRRRGLTGVSDSQQGAVFEAWTMTLRVKCQESNPSYGTKDDLRTFYGYNNPSGTPSNVITFYDNLNNSWQVEMAGTFEPDNLTTVLDGPNAAYLIAIALEAINP